MRRGAKVGTFRYPIRVGRIDGAADEALEPLVDADGSVIEREAGVVAITINGESVHTLCIFGDANSTPLLGAVTLEEAGLGPDPVRRRLIPVVGLLMAAV